MILLVIKKNLIDLAFFLAMYIVKEYAVLNHKVKLALKNILKLMKKIHYQKRQPYSCQGLTNDQIKQYVLRCPSDFGGSKNETELACRLFPQKFEDVHLVYNKLNYSE